MSRDESYDSMLSRRAAASTAAEAQTISRKWHAEHPPIFNAASQAIFYRVVCTHGHEREVLYPFEGQARITTDTGERLEFGAAWPAGARSANEQYQLSCPVCGDQERIRRPTLLRALSILAQHNHDTGNHTNDAELTVIRGIVRMS